MDMSFAVQALASLYIIENRGKLKPGVFDIPESIDQRIAQSKLESIGVRIDVLTEEQKRYLGSWNL